MSLIRPSIAVSIVALAQSLAPAHAAQTATAPTFYRDVLPIIQENCQVCHRPNGANLGGMVAPMAFETFAEARPWAKAMARAVETRKMPPWHAAPEQHGLFKNERTLTQAEIDTIVAWAKTGAKRGDAARAPTVEKIVTSAEWAIGEPDLIVRFDEPYFVKDDVEDEYVYLETTMTEELLPEDRYMKAVEFRPGSSAVHHIITIPLGGIAPGNEATIYPEGVGALLRKGDDLTWQMHYHKEAGPGTGMWDHSMVALKFYDDPADVKYKLQGNELGFYDFVIPAGASDYSVQQTYTFKHASRIISYMPHFHLRGKAAKYEVLYPDGSSEVLLEVPRYDFNWQTAYTYKQYKSVPKGTKLTFTTTWDNSSDNPFNPDPTVDVRYGDPTTDEMSVGYISFINDSDDYETFFDNFTGTGDAIDFTAVIVMYDWNKDGKMQREETPETFAPFFETMDRNDDGEVDMKEATEAKEEYLRKYLESE
ncbi:MAG: hypothetical protein VCD00_20420 [Candidatus Hydrogenedentota bacterium]